MAQNTYYSVCKFLAQFASVGLNLLAQPAQSQREQERGAPPPSRLSVAGRHDSVSAAIYNSESGVVTPVLVVFAESPVLFLSGSLCCTNILLRPIPGGLLPLGAVCAPCRNSCDGQREPGGRAASWLLAPRLRRITL